ncbi:cupin domain-containing protein [Sphingomonas sp. DT-204]|uniref:cupin domain-containing protein n=1 Tax=Sphingomonas sp. DT-204 TaxID=3396166 RepID=UPI003F1C8E01
MLRRSILQLPLLAWSTSLLAQTRPPGALPVDRVPSGADREGVKRAVGISATSFKVLSNETGGDLFVMEQSNNRKGGPSRHLHHDEDELFYVLEGEYLVEVGDTKAWLGPGDCVLGPRGIPHAWAFVGDTTGRLLISFAPANKMEAFFREREARGIRPGQYARTREDAAVLRAYGMEWIGPPIPPEDFRRT